MQLPHFVEKVISALEHEGYEAYCVGGCVRNSLLSIPVSDYDITTSALPKQVKQALFEYKIIETGLSHGTVTAVVDGSTIEITTFRSEAAYSDHRHPDSVTFARGLGDDLSRRDFTVNALAFNEKSGIIDPFGGRADLEKRLIRCVGEPSARFNEDALRILRALRFAACLGFSIEKQTAAAIKENYNLLSFVSKERIYSEFCRLLCGKNAPKIIEEFAEVIAFCLLPKQNYSAAIKSAAPTLAHIPQNPALRFAALFRFISPLSEKCAQCADSALCTLKADKKTRSAVFSLLSALPLKSAVDRCAVKELLRDHGAQKLADLILLERALSSQNDESLRFIEIEMEDIIKSGECYSLSSLKIRGSDLLKLGFEPNSIGNILNTLLSLVISEKLENTREQLLSAAKNLK